jgi:hypothetical protein
MTARDHTPNPRRKPGGDALAGGLGVTAALAVCCGAKLLLLGGLAVGVTSGLLRWWPLLLAAVAFAGWALLQVARRRNANFACAAPPQRSEQAVGVRTGSGVDEPGLAGARTVAEAVTSSTQAQDR